MAKLEPRKHHMASERVQLAVACERRIARHRRFESYRRVLRLFSIFAILICLAACSRPQDEALARLRKVDANRMRLEAARLYKNLNAAPGAEYGVLKPALWPQTFQQLQPVRVGCYLNGFALVFSGSGAKEAGLHVQPLGMDKEPTARFIQYDRIEEGIFWFQPK